MNPQRLIVVVASVAVVVTGGAWLLLPVMQPAQRRVESRAVVHVERARRLLDRFNADLAYRALLVDQLRDSDVEVDATDPAALAEDAGDAYQAKHEELWKSYEPKDWSAGTGRPARANYGNLAGQIRDGIGSRKKLVDENARLLTDALAEADAALAVSVGDASGRTYAEANRLNGTILYHLGLTERVKASLRRGEAEPILRELVDLAEQASALQGSQHLVAESGVDERIKSVRDKLSETESRVSESRSELSQLDKTVRELEGKWSAARARSDAAQAEVRRIRTAGVDFSDPNGGEAFRKRLMEHDAIFRAAEREAQELEAGSLPKAQIDASGDFLRGRYVEGGRTSDLTVSHGLLHYRDERSVVAIKIESEQKGIDGLKADLARLEALKQSYAQRQAEAAKRLPEIKPDAVAAYDDLSRVQSEAEAIEERALKYLDRSASAIQQAASLADQWVSESREKTQNLSPEAKERSAFNHRADDAWLSGFTAAQSADARSAKAWIYYDRFDAASRTADALATVIKSIPLGEVDVESVRAKADEARTAGIKEIETAMAVLEKAHLKAEKHWTLTAQGAGITYLMVLFGQKDYLADAVEAYRSAVKGRENESYAAKIVSRLQRLESR
ncbi:MAG: hypothetical protein Q7R41_06750 [Phycisphaerales bacterium]|nr:hypothetical protein [Phycisphaerales bacterium]